MKKSRRNSLIVQVALLFLVGIIVCGLISYYLQRHISDADVREETIALAEDAAEEVRMAVKEFPAYQFLLQFWYDHAHELDLEYDVLFTGVSKTKDKCIQWNVIHPNIQLRYATEAELKALPYADQKLYAEITYSWLITRINYIKRVHNMDYVFGIVADNDYKTQFYLFSGSDRRARRGTNYGEVYTLGVEYEPDEAVQVAMKKVLESDYYLAEAGKFVDYYTFLTAINGRKPVLIGLTYSKKTLEQLISERTRSGTSFAVGFLTVLAFICLVFVYFWVLWPLGKVQRSISEYRQTKDSGAVAKNLKDIRSHNELRSLSENVVSMTEEIDDYVKQIENITSERERISTELSVASRIQASMLPSTFPPFPDRTEFEIYASMDPAKEVGGDFYDFYLIDEEHLCMVMADVSGKGIPAALYMMASRIVLANTAMSGRSPAEILEAANNAICSNNREEMFVTVWLGILDLKTGVIKAANAGHEYPAIQGADGEFRIEKDRHGVMIGAMPGMKYPENEMVLKPNGKIFLYTDGVTEATDAEEKLFGNDRLLFALNKEQDADTEGVLKNVRGAIDEFVGEAEQFDDITMLCVKYNGPENRE